MTPLKASRVNPKRHKLEKSYMKAYNELPLYFQLSETTWCLIGFHGNHNHIDDVTSGRHLGFLNFQILFIFELNTENGEKTEYSDWNLQNC